VKAASKGRKTRGLEGRKLPGETNPAVGGDADKAINAYFRSGGLKR